MLQFTFLYAALQFSHMFYILFFRMIWEEWILVVALIYFIGNW